MTADIGDDYSQFVIRQRDQIEVVATPLAGRNDRAGDIETSKPGSIGGKQTSLNVAGKLDFLSEEKCYLRKNGTVLWTNRTVSLARP